MNRIRVLVVLEVLAGLASDALGCGCISSRPKLEDADLLSEASVIFRGKVLTVEPDPTEIVGFDPDTDEPILAGSRPNVVTNTNVTTLRVERVWKGNLHRVVKVKAGAHGGNCGVDFREGHRFIVFAALRDGELSTSSCTRTSPLEKGAVLAARLNKSVRR
jgi:hypothetical protein